MARKTKKLQQRSQFIILTNGQETEKNYFEELKTFRRSVYEIKVKFDNADPLRLVRRAINEKNSANQVWVVFDKDQFPSKTIEEAMRCARHNGIGVAFSNSSFEVWLIEHFEDLNSEKTNVELIRILNGILKREGYDSGYSKNDKQVLRQMFLPNLDEAMARADIFLQKKIKEHLETSPEAKIYPYCDWNPCTTVHKLVAAMRLEKRR